MIKLKKSYNHKGILLEPGMSLTLAHEIEAKMVKAGTAEYCTAFAEVEPTNKVEEKPGNELIKQLWEALDQKVNELDTANQRITELENQLKEAETKLTEGQAQAVVDPPKEPEKEPKKKGSK